MKFFSRKLLVILVSILFFSEISGAGSDWHKFYNQILNREIYFSKNWNAQYKWPYYNKEKYNVDDFLNQEQSPLRPKWQTRPVWPNERHSTNKFFREYLLDWADQYQYSVSGNPQFYEEPNKPLKYCPDLLSDGENLGITGKIGLTAQEITSRCCVCSSTEYGVPSGGLWSCEYPTIATRQRQCHSVDLSLSHFKGDILEDEITQENITVEIIPNSANQNYEILFSGKIKNVGDNLPIEGFLMELLLDEEVLKTFTGGRLESLSFREFSNRDFFAVNERFIVEPHNQTLSFRLTHTGKIQESELDDNIFTKDLDLPPFSISDLEPIDNSENLI